MRGHRGLSSAFPECFQAFVQEFEDDARADRQFGGGDGLRRPGDELVDLPELPAGSRRICRFIGFGLFRVPDAYHVGAESIGKEELVDIGKGDLEAFGAAVHDDGFVGDDQVGLVRKPLPDKQIQDKQGTQPEKEG